MTDIGNVITAGPRGECAHTGSAVAIAEGNTTTKAELFSRAKNAIEAGDQSLREAADALALAQEDFDTTQREIAEAVGKSAAWVNRLLRWRREGCPGTPFGPGSRAGRERRKRVQSTEQRAPHKVDTHNAEARTEKRNTECLKQEALPRSRGRTDPLTEFKYAVNHWLPQMDDDTKREAVEYAFAKSGVMHERQIKQSSFDAAVCRQAGRQQIAMLARRVILYRRPSLARLIPLQPTHVHD